jgi:hypothetical protein
LRELSKLYTVPSEDASHPALHKYTLRGISTTKRTMYIRTQAEPDLIDMDLDSDQSETKGEQWWRINYAVSGTNPVTVEVGTRFSCGRILDTRAMFLTA